MVARFLKYIYARSGSYYDKRIYTDRFGLRYGNMA